MGRPKEFDRDAVLGKAMDVFWSKGYECTSMQDLVDAMGINRGSLYDTFGGKRQLHLQSLEHFYQTQILDMMAPLMTPGSKKEAIRRIFTDIMTCACDGGDRRGCMIYNTAVELCPDDNEVGDRVSAGLKRVEGCFYDAVSEAQRAGEINTEKDARALARYLTTALNGFRVMCMVFDDRERLDDIIDTSLSILD